MPVGGFEAKHPAETIRALGDSGASHNLVSKRQVLQRSGKIDYGGVKYRFTKFASQELGGSLGPIVPGTCSLPLVSSDGTVVPLPLGCAHLVQFQPPRGICGAQRGADTDTNPSTNRWRR